MLLGYLLLRESRLMFQGINERRCSRCLLLLASAIITMIAVRLVRDL
jgi:hypothetical protein